MTRASGEALWQQVEAGLAAGGFGPSHGEGSGVSGSSAAAAERPSEEAAFEAMEAATEAARAAAATRDRSTEPSTDQRFWGDPRLLEGPEPLDGTAERWPKWHFRFVAWFSAVDPQAGKALEEAAAVQREIKLIAVPMSLARAGSFSSAALASYCRGLPPTDGSSYGGRQWLGGMESTQPGV